MSTHLKDTVLFIGEVYNLHMSNILCWTSLHHRWWQHRNNISIIKQTTRQNNSKT